MTFIERLELEFAQNYLKIHELIEKWQDTLERSRPSNLRFLDNLTTTLEYASTLLYGDLTDFKKMLDSYVAPPDGEQDVQLDALVSIWESIQPHVRVVEAAFQNIYKLL
ncbi:uncharacterized protein [Halyomorpha halys]|nr:uncharacterized protein LOC106681728 isoform X2 [Halyomorpha halys]